MLKKYLIVALTCSFVAGSLKTEEPQPSYIEQLWTSFVNNNWLFLGGTALAGISSAYAGVLVTMPLILPFANTIRAASKTVALAGGPLCIGACYACYELYKKLARKKGDNNATQRKSTYKEIIFKYVVLGCFTYGVYSAVALLYLCSRATPRAPGRMTIKELKGIAI